MSDPKGIPLRGDALPTAGFALIVDGKAKSVFPALATALAAAEDLKRKFPKIQVAVFDAVAHERTLVEISPAPAGPERGAEGKSSL